MSRRVLHQQAVGCAMLSYSARVAPRAGNVARRLLCRPLSSQLPSGNRTQHEKKSLGTYLDKVRLCMLHCVVGMQPLLSCSLRTSS